jgi:hypothetical protein
MSRISTDSLPWVVCADNMSIAWSMAFSKLAESPLGELAPLVVHITAQHGAPPEVSGIREAVDSRLAKDPKLVATRSTASLIFPQQIWQRHKSEGRKAFFNRYRDVVYPRLRSADARNRRGTYFQRMVQYGPSQYDQLSHVIDTRLANNRRRSAQQVVVFNPMTDHSDSPYLPFPCLDYLAFAAQKGGTLGLTAFYANQYLFDRAYGNYLGLWWLGCFVAEELGLSFRRLTCVAGVAQLGSIGVREARAFAAAVNRIAEKPRLLDGAGNSTAD